MKLIVHPCNSEGKKACRELSRTVLCHSDYESRMGQQLTPLTQRTYRTIAFSFPLSKLKLGDRCPQRFDNVRLI